MEKIILDADMGIDDVFALLLSIYSKKIDLKAVTTVEGNCILENANKNALKMLSLGLIKMNSTHLYITSKNFGIANQIILKLVE